MDYYLYFLVVVAALREPVAAALRGACLRQAALVYGHWRPHFVSAATLCSR
jgi:hypothetical protein